MCCVGCGLSLCVSKLYVFMLGNRLKSILGKFIFVCCLVIMKLVLRVDLKLLLRVLFWMSVMLIICWLKLDMRLLRILM